MNKWNYWPLQILGRNLYIANINFILEIWFPARDKTKNQKPQTYLYCHRLDYKLYLPSVDLDSKFTGVVKSAKIAESDDLVWPNRKLVADERPQKRDSHHDPGRLDPRSCSKCSSDRISSSDGAYEPCSHSIKKAEIPNFEVLVGRDFL